MPYGVCLTCKAVVKDCVDYTDHKGHDVMEIAFVFGGVKEDVSQYVEKIGNVYVRVVAKSIERWVHPNCGHTIIAYTGFLERGGDLEYLAVAVCEKCGILAVAPADILEPKKSAQELLSKVAVKVIEKKVIEKRIVAYTVERKVAKKRMVCRLCGSTIKYNDPVYIVRQIEGEYYTYHKTGAKHFRPRMVKKAVCAKCASKYGFTSKVIT